MSLTPLTHNSHLDGSALPSHLLDFDSSIYWPGDAKPLAVARQRTRTLLELWGLGYLVGDATVVVNELVTNVFEHAEGPALLQLSRMPHTLRVAVSDQVGFPVTMPEDVRHISATDPGGRGLLIVAALSCELECTVLRWGKCIAAELNVAMPSLIGR